MKGIKIILWICAVSCMLSFIAAVIPWKAITALYQQFNLRFFTSEPESIYVFRLFMIMTGMIGVFFAILARNPLKYDPMLQLAAYGLVIVGVFCILFGVLYNLPVWIYTTDAVFCIIAGVLLLVFRKKVV